MNVQQALKGKGFTIIEVVLVLAIAGLIFLMVFIALPALQSSQRDTARKTDVGTIASAVTSYTSNNRGAFPSTTQLTGGSTGTPGGYVSSVSTNTTSIKVGTAKATSVAVTTGQVVITQSTTCGATGSASGGTATQTLAVASTVSQFTVTSFLESGGGTSYCQES